MRHRDQMLAIWRVLLVAVILCLAQGRGWAADILYTDFESFTATNWHGWITDNGIWEVGNTAAAHQGTKCAATVLAGNVPVEQQSRLISPPVDLPALASSEGITLRFWLKWLGDYGGYFGAYSRVDVRVWNGTSFGNWQSVSGNYTGENPVWSPASVDLSSFASKRVQLGFSYYSGYGADPDGCYIDDVCVSVGPPETLPLNEIVSFEDFTSVDWHGWSADNGIWEVGDTPAAHQGAKCAATVLAGNVPVEQQSRLISPPVDLPALASSEGITLRFWLKWLGDYGGYFGAYSRVDVRVWNGTSFGNWQSVSGNYTGENPVWSPASVDLSSFASKRIQLGFYYYSGNGADPDGCYIDDVSVEVPPPTVTSISPKQGQNTGSISITDLAGKHFDAGATVKLVKTGQADIPGTSVTVVSSTKITCSFSLTGKATGAWDVVVTNPDTDSATLPGGFSVYHALPQNVSLTPSGGTLGATAKTLTGVYSDADGVTDIRKAYLLINDSTGQANSAQVCYDRLANKLYLKNDAGTSWGTGYAPGTAAVLENSQCTFDLQNTSVSASGNDLTVNWRIALKTAHVAKLLDGYLFVQENSGATDGWDMLGIYRNLKPQVVSISPNSAVLPIDSTTTLTSVYRDPNGYADIRKCYLLVCEGFNQPNSMFLYYDRQTNKVYLKDDANTSWGPGYAPGSTVTLANGQCEVYLATTTVSGTGNDVIIGWSFKLKPGMADKNLYSWMYVTDSKGLLDGWKKMGTHFTPVAPTCVSVTPSTGKVTAGAAQLFTTEYSDVNNYGNISQCFFQIGQSGSLANSICVLYDAKQNNVFLRDDANLSWSTGYAPGSNVTLENSRGVVYVKDILLSSNGLDGLVIDWSIALKANLIGKLLGERMFCRDNENMNSGWKLKGYVRAQ